MIRKKALLPPGAKVVGKVVMRPLGEVKPNSWNPNAMTSFEKASLKFGLETDGWLISQALLVWGSDEKGKKKNLIIDGEHRWTVAGEIGFPEGPMVMLDRLSEAKAKALTIKMNAKRGKFEDAPLADVLRSIQQEFGGDITLDLGIAEERMMMLLAEPTVLIPGGDVDVDVGAKGVDGNNQGVLVSSVRMVQLFFNVDSHAEFSELIRQLSAVYGTKNVTDTALEAIKRAFASIEIEG